MTMTSIAIDQTIRTLARPCGACGGRGEKRECHQQSLRCGSRLIGNIEQVERVLQLRQGIFGKRLPGSAAKRLRDVGKTAQTTLRFPSNSAIRGVKVTWTVFKPAHGLILPFYGGLSTSTVGQTTVTGFSSEPMPEISMRDDVAVLKGERIGRDDAVPVRRIGAARNSWQAEEKLRELGKRNA